MSQQCLMNIKFIVACHVYHTTIHSIVWLLFFCYCFAGLLFFCSEVERIFGSDFLKTNLGESGMKTQQCTKICKILTYQSHMDKSHKTMMSVLMGYSDKWQSDKKVPCIGNLIHLQKQTQALMSQL